MTQIPLTIRTVDERPLVKIVYDVIPAPAAGQNLTFTCPPGYQYQLKSLFVTVVTDANVINRTLFVRLVTNVGTVYYFEHPFAISSAETRSLCLAPGSPLIPHTVALMTACFPFPTDMTIEEGSTLTIGLTSIQVGDQFAATSVMFFSQFVAE